MIESRLNPFGAVLTAGVWMHRIAKIAVVMGALGVFVGSLATEEGREIWDGLLE